MIEQAVNEEWRPVVGYETKYEVSNFGRVRSLEQRGGAGLMRRRVPLVMRQRRGVGGYHVLSLTDGESKTCLVHRLVLIAFSGPPAIGMQCCHLDGNPSNNAASNLAWGTGKENCRQRTAHGRGGKGKLTPALRDEIRARYLRTSYHGSNTIELATAFRVSKSLIRSVVRDG